MAQLVEIRGLDEESKNGKLSDTYDNKGFEKDEKETEFVNKVASRKDEYEDDNGNCWTRAVDGISDSVSNVFQRRTKILKGSLLLCLLLLYFAYFAYCMYHKFGDEGSYRLMVCTVLVSLLLVWQLITRKELKILTACGQSCARLLENGKFTRAIGWILGLAVTIALGVYIVLDIAIKSPRNLISLGGLFAFILVFYVNWRPVFWGIAMQYIFALMILRTQWGYDIFQWSGDRVSEFIACSDAGAQFVFGQAYTQHMFAFKMVTLTYIGILGLAVTIALGVYIVLDIAIKSPRNLISLGGLFAFILVFYVTSTRPAKVNWRPVFWGIAMQYIFALMILRTQWGYDIFQWSGDRVSEFIACSDAGAQFVFGQAYTQHMFAFKVMPVVVFFISMISILYHFGVMQAIIRTVGRFLAFSLGTTPAESLNVAANMFIGQSEALALISPFLPDMTKSELHAALTGGFASVSGSTLGAYISLGVPANHLLSATVMSAPAAFAISKLTYPETEVSKASASDFYKMSTEKVHNVIEAAYQGAATSIKIVANICINVVAFLAILKFPNNTLTWFGDRAGVDGLTFEFICSYVMYPVAFLMGADTDDCRKVAELIGIKTFLNEFIAYTYLGTIISNRAVFENYTSVFNSTESWIWNGGNIVLNHWNTTLVGGVITQRSESIATYALCGYSNFGSIGINLGALLAFAPQRKTDGPTLVLRAMIAGSAACFLTGAVAGLLYKDF